ncbi:MAG: glutamine-synthetase adenylyltransferase, partial [Sphingomonadaceae bacterium]|nr:glutamine-synthetase adenylyltransferase [Sphingomonadaceae bacterium]
MKNTASAAVADAIDRASRCSPFLRQLIETSGDLMPPIQRGDFAEAMRLADAREEGDDSLAVALRRQRAGLALVLALGDLAGALSLEQVVEPLSD